MNWTQLKVDQIYCVTQDVDGEGETLTRNLQYRGRDLDDSCGSATLIFWEEVGSPIELFSGDILALEEVFANLKE
jgi:hypothetical protein